MARRALVAPAALVAALTLAACGSATPTTTTTLAQAHDLVVAPAVRRSLLDADAAYHHLPARDYQGLVAGETYYAYDTATRTYYAAAGLVPSPTSLPAQIGTQDDGSYNLFTRASSRRTWRVYDDGLGADQDAICPIVIPAAVLRVWGWRAGSCYPPTGG